MSTCKFHHMLVHSLTTGRVFYGIYMNLVMTNFVELICIVKLCDNFTSAWRNRFCNHHALCKCSRALKWNEFERASKENIHSFLSNCHASEWRTLQSVFTFFFFLLAQLPNQFMYILFTCLRHTWAEGGHNCGTKLFLFGEWIQGDIRHDPSQHKMQREI